jgi:FAD/FMN-containing dehydrogenase/Fe-S oxidoreductase
LNADRRVTITRNGRVRTAATTVPGLNPRALADQLAADISGEVRFDAGSRALYATDSSNYRQVPIGVVVPASRADVIRTVAICREHNAPLLPRGGGTSLAGECCNTAVVVDFSKYLNRVLSIDVQRRLARVEPGCILDNLRETAAKQGLTFGPDPATHDHNTLGGMIGNNSGGVHALMSGITVFNVQSMDIVTYDGLALTVGPTGEEAFRAILRGGGRPAEIYRRLDALRRRYGDEIRERFPRIPRRVSGYGNLDQLFPEEGFNVARALVGTEGTCALVLEATLNLIPNPAQRVLAIIGFPDIFRAADAVPRVLTHHPIGLEGFDDTLVDRYKTKGLHAQDLEVLPEGRGWLLVELGGASEEEAAAKGQALVHAFEGEQGAAPKLVRDKHEQKRIWRVRDDALGAESYVPNHPDTWPGWEDSAVHPDNLGAYLRDLEALFARYGYHPVIYGHFGDGLVHCAIAFDLYSEPGVATWRRFLQEAAELVVRHGGSLSGEHGDGQARGALLETMYGAELVQAFREFKAIWDPHGGMNPGKVIDPYPITSNLRVGPAYAPPALASHFAFRADKGSFARAAQRCVGVGKCRRRDSKDEVMCPSYLVTNEEKHSTRGRARLLFEMVHGGPIDDGWRSGEVEEALSLCLACKGCRRDCPVGVDMATYKAEFRAHHYAGRWRPRSAYSMGLIHRWAPWASLAPGLVNFLAQTGVLRAIAKWVAGMAQERAIPAFARETFTGWFRRQAAPENRGARVLLWPDTFNNYFRPQTAIAATRVLRAAGFDVAIPPRPLCCGRPLYDWGMLDTAKQLWRDTLAALREEIEAGTPLVVLEPACLSAFQDELTNLFPDDPLAKRLCAQSFYFSDFLVARAGRLDLRTGGGRALVQIHCHHHAVIGTGGERTLLDRLGLEATILASGCCGMAGAFGLAADTCAVGIAAGERVLLPAIRAAAPDMLIVADGFSCREQIEQGTARKALHVAEIAAERCG